MSEIAAPHLVLAELDAVENGREFRASARHRQFLRYLVEQWLAGRASSLKEISLGVAVFGRAAHSFDPSADTIVRVEARRLRARLARHYETQGRNSSLVIALHPGSYVPTVSQRRPQSDVAEPTMPQIVVLPFLSTDGEPLLREWCESLTDDLTDALARTIGLRVVARTSAFHFDSDLTSPDVFARRLNAGIVIEGDVTLEHERYAVSVRATDVVSGQTVWHDRYHAEPQERFTLPDRVSVAVVQALLGARALWTADVGIAAAPPPRTRSFASAADHDLFSRARIAFQQRSTAGYQTAANLFSQLAARSPASPHALCGLARAWLALVGMGIASVRELLPRARQAAVAALEIDAQFGEADAVIGQIALMLDHDWPTAERHFARAIGNAPSLPYPHHVRAFGLLYQARFDDAEQAFSVAQRIDPLDVQIRVQHGLVPFYQRRYEEAIELWEDVLEVHPENLIATTLIGAARLCQGDGTQALASYQSAISRVPDHPIGWAGSAQAHALLGNEEAVSEMTGRLQGMQPRQYVSPYLFAMIDCRRGKPDAAFRWLQASAEEPDFNFVCAGVDPSFDALRGDPRWNKLMRAHRLPLA
jgi:TolB-like protein/Tfp pilus assembly protein PilF